MKNLLSITCLMTLAMSVQAQHYSGKFSHKPELEEFDHFIVMRHQEESKGDLTVKAFTSWGDLWHSKAEKASQQDSRQLKQNFGRKIDVRSIYSIDFVNDHEDWKYFMIKYRNGRKQEHQFMIVEESFHRLDDVHLVEVHSFVWDNATASTGN